jgi:hypothetical protein
MDLESIIWIVIFLIYIAFIILKKTRRAAKTKQPPAVTGLGPDQTAGPVAAMEDSEKAAEKKRSDWKQILTGLPGQLQGRLGDFINQIQQELEAAKKKDEKDRSVDTGWEKFLSAKDHEAELVAKKKATAVAATATDHKKIKAGIMKDAAGKTAAPMPRKVAAPGRLQPVKPPSSSKPKPSVQKIAVDRKEPAFAKTDITASVLTYTVQDLRKAVVWSEILAPPVALREDHK